MNYHEHLKAFGERLQHETYAAMLCEECYSCLTDLVDRDGLIKEENVKVFMTTVVQFAEHMKDNLRRNVPPAWGEDE